MVHQSEGIPGDRRKVVFVPRPTEVLERMAEQGLHDSTCLDAFFPVATCILFRAVFVVFRQPLDRSRRKELICTTPG